MWTAVLASLLMVLGLASTSASGQTDGAPADTTGTAAKQTLTWTAGNDITKYMSVTTTAVAGPTTIVFENSKATGNTTGMPHTLTFDVSDPEYNNDVPLNILANPNDDQGGKYTAEVTLTPGRYRFFCTIPGHGQMQGILVVTEGGGEDTTAPETAAAVSGTQNADGAYVGSATVTLSATDAGSGLERIEYAIGDAGAWQPYTTPVVVDQVGAHKVRYRALDKAGNVAAEKAESFTVVAKPTDDTTPPETSASVTGEQNPQGEYISMATVTVTASDTGSGVNTIEYAIG
ncbi:plastocyanin/azurin family copper-binding protein, partial [Streptomyces sp. ActVer]|uniref:OmpL47-type beta-barrel domain-containing protein n=1 Tax=Streptomyces sp. ActVer TaxID=3014558 RepID=UPI0022B535FE